MLFDKLTKELEGEVIFGEGNPDITSLVYDSRKIEPGCIFVCIKGANFDGHDAAKEAFEKGACAIVVEHEVDITPGDIPGGTPIIYKTPDTRLALALLSAAWFDHPASSLKVIGITGTKGKTTTTYMIKSILENAGIPTGLIGTIEAIIGDKRIPALNTTPESYVIQEYFAMMRDEGLKAVVMEVSSQGLMLKRTEGFIFDIGIFTNLEEDHIGPNEHSSFDDYVYCKSLLFKQCRLGLVNTDDPLWERVLKDHTCDVLTYGFSEKADYRACDVSYTNDAGVLGVKYNVEGRRNITARVSIPGDFTVYNSLCAIAVCDRFNVSDDDILSALLSAKVKGRIEPLDVPGNYSLMIDYAHNAMSLKSLITSLRHYDIKRLVVLFGCGGNRSKTRRFEMGEIAGNMADFTIITSDNPRNEDPMDIINDIETGMKKTNGLYIKIPDRKEAIRYAMKEALDGDVIILAGKGHEDYQEICGVKHHMDERELVADIIREEGM